MGSCNSKPQKDTVQAPPKDATGDELKPQPAPKPAATATDNKPEPVKVDDVSVKDQHKQHGHGEHHHGHHGHGGHGGDVSTSVSSSSSSGGGFVRPPIADLWHSSASPAKVEPVAAPPADFHAVPDLPSPAGHHRISDAPFSLTINGTVYNPTDRSQLLVDFLHSNVVGLPGTKLACGQGGCGACTVNVVFNGSDPNNVRAINSCLRPLGLLEGASITTIEGLNSEYPPLPGKAKKMLGGEGGGCCGGCGGHGAEANKGGAGCGGHGHHQGAGDKAHACPGPSSCSTADQAKCSTADKIKCGHAGQGHPQGENKSLFDSKEASAVIEAEHERTAAAKAKGAKSVGDTNADPRLVLATYNGTQCGVRHRAHTQKRRESASGNECSHRVSRWLFVCVLVCCSALFVSIVF